MNALDKVKGLVTDEMVEAAILAGHTTSDNYLDSRWPDDYGENEIAHGRAFMRAALEAAILPELEAMARDAGRWRKCNALCCSEEGPPAELAHAWMTGQHESAELAIDQAQGGSDEA